VGAFGFGQLFLVAGISTTLGLLAFTNFIGKTSQLDLNINLREQTDVVPATLKSQFIIACIIGQLCAGLCLHRLCARNRAHERQNFASRE
jgi:hypothetical protein